MNKDFFKSSNPSRFHSLRDTRPDPTTWQVLFKEITNSTHTAATRHYRAHLATLSDIEATGDAQQLEQWKLTKSNLKNAQPAFIPSVLLEGGRTYAHVKGFTGFIMVDIDGIPPERFAAILTLVKEDIHSFLVYITISGCGIRVISHVEGGVTKANYRMVWEWVNDHYARLCGVEIDGQCKNATRMSVLCHDPEALLRPEASSFHTSGMKPREKPKRGTAVTVTAERAYKIIRAQLEEEGIAYATGQLQRLRKPLFLSYQPLRCSAGGRRGMGPPDFSRLSARAAAAHRKKLLLAHDGVQHRSPAPFRPKKGERE